MKEQNRNQLQHAEKLLREGKNREASSFLAGYLQQHPDSGHGWWLLSFAVPDLKQQIDCVERVLRIDPHSALAQARLDKLRENSSDLPPPVPPFVEKISFDEPEVPPVQPPKQDSKPVVAQAPAPVVKKKNRVWQYVILIVVACILLAVIGVAVVMLIQNDRSTATATPVSFTQISLPPTWTPPPTTTRGPSLTPYPTITPVILPTLDVTPTSTATDFTSP